MSSVVRAAVFTVLLAVTPPAWAKEPTAIGKPIKVGTHTVTLLHSMKLEPEARKCRHGTSADGMRLIWLIEGVTEKGEQIVYGGVRLTFDGKQYNPIVNPTSSGIHRQGRRDSFREEGGR
jgi:hypothetical protein